MKTILLMIYLCSPVGECKYTSMPMLESASVLQCQMQAPMVIATEHKGLTHNNKKIDHWKCVEE